MLSPDQETDLRWYFTEARGDCGLRSGMGGQIDSLAERALAVRGDGIHTMTLKPPSPPGINHAEAAMARICDSGKPGRASAIAARLRVLPPCHVSTLQHQYSDPEKINGTGVSVALATVQKLTAETFRELRLRKRQPSATQRLWLVGLIAAAIKEPVSEQARILGTILAQARTALGEAQEAYQKEEGRMQCKR